MSRKKPSGTELEALLGYHFQDPALLTRALTHSSAIAPSKRTENSYQRLEFLGDRVLGLVVADQLSRQAPGANEGELSRTLNSVVRKESCADVARALELGKYIHLGESEARTGGADKDAILADVCEAVIGAIYTDAGLDQAYAFVLRVFADHLNNAEARRADPKTALQEWAQARGLPPPAYVEVARSGPDHAPVFTIGIDIAGFDRVSADGASKKVAERKAAEHFLEREGIRKAGK